MMKTFKKYGIMSAAVIAAALLTLASCYREPIYRPLKNVQMKFRIDLSLNDSTQWVKPDTVGPSLLRVNFYNPQTHKLEGFMHTTKKGGEISGVGAGTYDIVVFNDDTEYTRIAAQENSNTIQAYTDKIATKIKSKSKTKQTKADDDGGYSSELDESIAITMPDHLFVGRAQLVEIPEYSEKDTAVVIPMTIKTIIESYKVQIDGIKGLENITTADLYLSGHAVGNFFGQGKRSEEVALLHVPCYVDLADYCIRAMCTTFGKVMDVRGLAGLHLIVGGEDGSVYDFEADITQQYLKPDHFLHFHLDGDIRARDENQFRPKAEKWVDEEEWEIVLE